MPLLANMATCSPGWPKGKKVRSTIAGKLTPIMQSLVVYTGRVDVSLFWGDGMCNFRPLCRRSEILRLFQK